MTDQKYKGKRTDSGLPSRRHDMIRPLLPRELQKRVIPRGRTITAGLRAHGRAASRQEAGCYCNAASQPGELASTAQCQWHRFVPIHRCGAAPAWTGFPLRPSNSAGHRDGTQDIVFERGRQCLVGGSAAASGWPLELARKCRENGPKAYIIRPHFRFGCWVPDYRPGNTVGAIKVFEGLSARSSTG